MPVSSGRQVPRREPEQAGGKDEGGRTPPAPRRRRDGAAIRIGGTLEIPGERDVGLKAEVDHPSACSAAVRRASRSYEGAAVDFGPEGGEGGGRFLGRAEADNLVTCGDESSGTTAEPIQPEAPVTKCA